MRPSRVRQASRRPGIIIVTTDGQATTANPDRQSVDHVCDVVEPFAQRPAVAFEDLYLLCPGRDR
jgi:hypothetical protein